LAGGGLAASVVLHANKSRSKKPRSSRLLAKYCVFPGLLILRLIHSISWHRKKKSFYVQNINAPILPQRNHILFADLLNVKDPFDIYLSPVLAPDAIVKGMPKSVFLVAGQDPLRNKGLLYTEKLKANR
jgi:acetyl esterase/lipase